MATKSSVNPLAVFDASPEMSMKSSLTPRHCCDSDPLI